MRPGVAGSAARGAALLLALLLGACAAAEAPFAWDGRRGYDGNGDYGYDPDAPAEAAVLRASTAAAYPAPGPSWDPWGPYLAEASSRTGLPETWLRAVMQQESGGRTLDGNGRPITSVAGAMGLMQVMPDTYERLRRRHGLSDDPFEPQSNILAGAAFLREMHDRFGAPLFLAAYNAGPQRVDNVLAGHQILPDETERYLAVLSSRLGMQPAALPFP